MIYVHPSVNYITVLIKSTGKTFIVVGTSGELSRILDTSLQLSRHFAFRESLAPFPFKEDEEKNEFNRFISLAEQTIGYSLDPDEARKKLVGKIYKATKGVVGNIMNLMRGSALYARHDDSPIILRYHLKKAYRKRLSGQVNLKDNPNPF